MQVVDQAFAGAVQLRIAEKQTRIIKPGFVGRGSESGKARMVRHIGSSGEAVVHCKNLSTEVKVNRKWRIYDAGNEY